MTDVLNSTVAAPSGPSLVGGPPEAADAQGLTARSLSPRQMAWRRFLGHKPAVVATIALVVMILFVVAAPLTARYGVR